MEKNTHQANKICRDTATRRRLNRYLELDHSRFPSNCMSNLNSTERMITLIAKVPFDAL